MNCLEGLSVKCLTKESTINLDLADNLPELVRSNLHTFRLTFQCLAEFSMKYCTDSPINIMVDFVEMSSDEKRMVIQFDITMLLNHKFETEPLKELLSEGNNLSRTFADELVFKNYVKFFDII
jgi:hypothetical protein